MVKDIVLKFEINSNSFKDGNLLLYDKNRGYFYAITPEMFLTKQNEKIKALEKEYKEKEESMKKEVQRLERKVQEQEKKYDEFLNKYRLNNEKLLSMVESFIKKYGGEN